MHKYEIMVIVSGKTEEKSVLKVVDKEINLIKKTKNFKCTELGLKKLAYPIAHETTAYYLIFNFECDDSQIINEFKRVVLLNKCVLRNLIINLDNDYGARALDNPKKVANSKSKFDKYKDEYEKNKSEWEKRKQFASSISKQIENLDDGDQGKYAKITDDIIADDITDLNNDEEEILEKQKITKTLSKVKVKKAVKK